MGENVMFQLQLTMFFMLAVGFFCAKKGLLDARGRESITNVFISVIIPCSIVSSFYSSMTPELLIQGAWMVAVYTGTLVFCWLAGKVLYAFCAPSRKKVLNYATMISNAQFMGFPIVEAVMGEEGLVLAALAMIPGNVFTWTIALGQFTKISGKEGIRNTVTHPCFLAVIAGLLLSLLKISLPLCVADGIKRLGDCVMPVSMLIIGAILSEVRLRDIFDWQLYYYSFFRLIGIPAVLFAVFTLLNIDPMVRNTTVIMAAMPAGTVTAMLAQKHGADASFASRVIFVSTFLSIFTLSAVYGLLS